MKKIISVVSIAMLALSMVALATLPTAVATKYDHKAIVDMNGEIDKASLNDFKTPDQREHKHQMKIVWVEFANKIQAAGNEDSDVDNTWVCTSTALHIWFDNALFRNLRDRAQCPEFIG